MLPDSLTHFKVACSTHLLQATLSDVFEMLHSKDKMIICDRKIFKLYQNVLQLSCIENIILLPAGDRYKNQSTVNKILSWLHSRQVTRQTAIIGLGGGTITDVAAFAASIFKRGCKLTLIPTTMVGMVDAAVGGKTGINFGYSKNLIGTFYPANEIVIAPDFLASLPPDELQNGLAEMLKLWFIKPGLTLPSLNSDMLIRTSIVYDYAAAKLNICSQDLLDTGLRRHLNLGHTFAHAIESYSNFKVAHGKAVGKGMHLAALCSYKLGYISEQVYSEIVAIMHDSGFKTALKSTLTTDFLNALPDFLNQDKKKSSGKLTLILFQGLHQTTVMSDLSNIELISLLKV